MEKMEEEQGGVVEKKEKPRDIRRFYCEFCGICRSKKSLIASHLQTHHKKETEMNMDGIDEQEEAKSSNNTCQECGASFQKPAHLKQHMLSHSLERPFTCPVDDCHSSYRRKDHLNRHLLQHQGKLFSCPVEGCNKRFAYKANMKRHVEDIHEDEDTSSSDSQGQTQHICQEVGCGKVFKYASKLRKHEESHVKLESVEAICCEPGCMKYFANNDCLKAHVQSCHQHVLCEVCGTKQLKKNMKRHMRGHENEGSSERIKCSFKDCECTFANKSNLNQHVKSVHLELRPFACQFPGCGQRFAFKHVRDNHEKSGCHIYVHGDFEEADEQLQTRPRGGRKRTCPTVETLLRKRVVPPSHTDSVLNHAPEYLAWLLSAEGDC
ncbi:transcription factor IIIA-like [Papaver somniferum]|uniref:transcription factor IIIA-like n=1 Tax=Papaver somniferum TaxID=3469 RepID=UPI000E704481|nr:transcription factor IIIA-like [Papaver somniferum]